MSLDGSWASSRGRPTRKIAPTRLIRCQSWYLEVCQWLNSPTYSLAQVSPSLAAYSFAMEPKQRARGTTLMSLRVEPSQSSCTVTYCTSRVRHVEQYGRTPTTSRLDLTPRAMITTTYLHSYCLPTCPGLHSSVSFNLVKAHRTGDAEDVMGTTRSLALSEMPLVQGQEQNAGYHWQVQVVVERKRDDLCHGPADAPQQRGHQQRATTLAGTYPKRTEN